MTYQMGGPGAGPEVFRKCSGTTKTLVLDSRHKSLYGIRLGVQVSLRCGFATPGSSGFRRGVVVRYRLLPTKGGRLPTAIQDNQRSQGCALAPQAEGVLVFVLAIPHAFALQERRAPALLVRRFAGALYLLPLACMDAIKKDARSFFDTVYAQNQRPRLRHEAHFHLGWMFDVTVIVTLLIAVIGYFTA